MGHHYVGLVDVENAIDPEELHRVATALTAQVNDHFAPKWGVTATVGIDAKPRQHSWTIELRMKTDPKHPPGYHVDPDGKDQALAVVQLSSLPAKARYLWPVVASHELLEMLVDPKGERKALALPHPDDATVKVDYLMEICDPCSTQWYWIQLPDGDRVRVSDFVVQEYYDPKTLGSVSSYSHTGSILEPLDVLPRKPRKGDAPGKEKEYASFVSFLDPTKTTWFCKVRDAKGPAFVKPVDEKLVIHSYVREVIESAERADLEPVTMG